MNLEVYDIECMVEMFLYIGKNIKTGKYVQFEVSAFKNDLEGLVKHLLDSEIDYGVSYNGNSYDMQILQYILDNHRKWYDLSNMEIIKLIKKFSDKVIDDTKYDLFPPYREESFSIKQIDLFKVHHFDNEARRTSLKWLQFSMDFYNVEEMPIHHMATGLTEEDVKTIRDYCRNDVESTVEFYKYTVGDVKHDIYKGQNKIEDRVNLIKEFGFPEKAMSWSDVKIGDEINKKTYCEITGLDDKKLYDLKKSRKPTKPFTYGDCIPDYVSFVTPEFQEFFIRMKKVRVHLTEKKEYPFTYKGTSYMIAKGGIHSNEKNRIIEPGVNELCLDADIGSQYPTSLIKRGLFPSHLGKPWLVGYTKTRDRRLEYKEKIKSAVAEEKQKLKGLSETFKLALNGGGFGKTNEKNSWQYDPFVHFSCTIGNQFEILMLIEMLEVAGIHVVSANTDGIVCLFDKSKKEKYYEVCKKWEEVVGNTTHGQLEYVEYKKIVQANVNHYLAVKMDGTVKKKGSFLTSFELNKNKSKSVINIALEKYFTEGVPVAETIRNHQSIFEFCIGLKASRDYHYENMDKNGKEIYHRLVRYIISMDGKKLYKVKNEDSMAPGPQLSQVDAGNWKATVINRIDKDTPIKDYKIDYSYYIDAAEDRIRDIEAGRKGVKKVDPNQISLF